MGPLQGKHSVFLEKAGGGGGLLFSGWSQEGLSEAVGLHLSLHPLPPRLVSQERQFEPGGLRGTVPR